MSTAYKIAVIAAENRSKIKNSKRQLSQSTDLRTKLENASTLFDLIRRTTIIKNRRMIRMKQSKTNKTIMSNQQLKKEFIDLLSILSIQQRKKH